MSVPSKFEMFGIGFAFDVAIEYSFHEFVGTFDPQ